MKKNLALLILLSPIFFGACSWSNKIPEDLPPTITVPVVEEEEILTEELSENESTVEADKQLKYEVVLPSKERETQRLLDEYQATLNNIEANLK